MKGALLSLTLVLGFVLVSCQSSQDEFASGRLEKFCDGTIPICAVQAACIVEKTDYLDADFPGGQRFIVQANELDSQLVARLFFNEMIYPGTEFLLKVYGPGCSTIETEHLLDVDLFERAGDDRTVTFLLPIHEKGDHLIELFSDMAATYLMTIDLER